MNRGDSRAEIFSKEADDEAFERIPGDELARNIRDALPNASCIGFTGTPIDQNDDNTRAVGGEYVSVHDIQQAVIDKATVLIDCESRIAKLSLNEAELPRVESEFAEIAAGEEEDRQQKLKAKWAALEALVGSDKRIRRIAEVLVQHFARQLRTYRHQPERAGVRFEPGLAPRGSCGELLFCRSPYCCVRNSEGVVPVADRKARVKALWS